MASAGVRSLTRASLTSLRSCLARPKGMSASAAAAAASVPPSPPARRLPWSCRSPVELGCRAGSLLPLHSAAAAARLSSRLSSSFLSCCALSQDGIDGT